VADSTVLDLTNPTIADDIDEAQAHADFFESLAEQARDEEFVREHADEAQDFDDLLTLRERGMAEGEWLRQLGRMWGFIDSHTYYIERLRPLLRAGPFPIEGMMTEEERERFARLPEELTVYRGCWGSNAAGICWSLSNEIAAAMWGDDMPLLITGRVPKTRVVALKLGRGEVEVISFDVREVKRERSASTRAPG